MQLSLRDKLAFPAGVAPGFDPGHVAAKNVLASVIPVGGSNFLNLLNAAYGTQTSPLVSGLDGVLGPFVNQNVNGHNDFVIPTASYLPVTFACFVMLSSLTATSFASNAGWRFTWDGAHIALVSNGVTNLASTLTLSTNTPYFIAVSASSSQCFYVVTNLISASIQNYTKGSGSGSVASAGNYKVPGFDSASWLNNGRLGPGMMSGAFMSMPQLLAWAASPWDFWYPASGEPITPAAPFVPVYPSILRSVAL